MFIHECKIANWEEKCGRVSCTKHCAKIGLPEGNRRIYGVEVDRGRMGGEDIFGEDEVVGIVCYISLERVGRRSVCLIISLF